MKMQEARHMNTNQEMEHIPHAFVTFVVAYMRTSWMNRQVYAALYLQQQ